MELRNAPSQGFGVNPAQGLLGRRSRTISVMHSSLRSPEWRPCSEQVGNKKDLCYRKACDLQLLHIGDKVIQPQRESSLGKRRGSEQFGGKTVPCNDKKGKYCYNCRQLHAVAGNAPDNAIENCARNQSPGKVSNRKRWKRKLPNRADKQLQHWKKTLMKRKFARATINTKLQEG